ncbi:unnamed protein product [Staurois parvus]|uniref:Uncharacterized protein n=1 Tax=Staurois parvus TaxID=386267 RepID=A0ABN9HKL3_9NEOB|nr:unnamed protein product [Staurois parvus]
MRDKLGRNILCSVFCPFEYLENALHTFFMMKKGSGQHRELEELKKKFQTQIHINSIWLCCI